MIILFVTGGIRWMVGKRVFVNALGYVAHRREVTLAALGLSFLLAGLSGFAFNVGSRPLWIASLVLGFLADCALAFLVVTEKWGATGSPAPEARSRAKEVRTRVTVGDSAHGSESVTVVPHPAPATPSSGPPRAATAVLNAIGPLLGVDPVQVAAFRSTHMNLLDIDPRYGKQTFDQTGTPFALDQATKDAIVPPSERPPKTN